MDESVFASPGGTAGMLAFDAAGLGDSIALVPGRDGTAWIYHAAGAAHLCRDTLRDVLFLGHTVCLELEPGAIILRPVGPSIEVSTAFEPGRPGPVYLAPRDTLAQVARGLIASARFGPIRG